MKNFLKQLGLIGISLIIAYASFTYETPYMVGEDGIVPQGGFPFVFLKDNCCSSVIGMLGPPEDDFYLLPFLGNTLFYFLILNLIIFIYRQFRRNKRPKVLTDAGYEIYCDTVKLREVDLPVVDFEIDKLIWNFDLPLWEKDGTDDWNLTPRDVINKIKGSSIHQERVRQADLQFPVLLLNKNDKWLVIDGVHRLVKAYQANQKTIKAKVYTLEIVQKHPSTL